jgi:opacity protein-like surface antigen
MKAFRRVWTGLVVIGSVYAAPAVAQGAEFSLGGGATLPLSDFGDVASTGWHGLAAVSFAPSTFPLGIQVDGMYQRFGFEDAPDDFDGNFQLIQGTANAIYKFKSSPDSPVRPYIIGGVGLYNFKATGDDVIDDGSNTDFGVNAGAGFDFKLGSVGAFVEGRFHNVFADEVDLRMIPITVGLRLGGN